ncbi:helix-turn-helix transcriptional regulator [Danxiaibacter flavus]|uniref:Helix-turn-helix transcriptional regulator n=1 Tax=Danxiaibacter flavus TaxID=3049108 RepID=A0ABV3ZMB3_9BACT|nr:helix-turn-helix transcriptional regulator [Chitinophagaceae bacterium DXS]
MAEHTIHQGEKIKRFREMLGVKQDALAMELGDDWNQRKVSMLEAKAEIEPALFEKVAKALKVPKEAIENFDTKEAVNIFSHNSYDSSTINSYNCSNTQIFNPIEEILKIYKEKEALCERMLKDKDEMIARLEKLLEK